MKELHISVEPRKKLRKLEKTLKNKKIKNEDICIVGSFILEALGLRESRDIDLCVNLETRESLTSENSPLSLNDKIEIISKNWGSFFGLEDEELIYNDKYHIKIDQFKIIRPEILYIRKKFTNRKKDETDILLMEKKLFDSNLWDWNLFKEIYDEFKGRKKDSVLSRQKFSGLIRKIINNPQNVLHYAHHKTRSALQKTPPPKTNQTSLNSQLITKIHTSALLGNSLTEKSFFRYDVIMRYITIDAILNDNKEIINIYKKVQKKRVNRHTFFNFQHLIKSIENRGFQSKYPILLNKNGQLLDGSHRLACALYFDIDEVPVKVRNTKKEVKYDKEWFINNGIKKDFIRKMEKQKKKLFLEKGIYFPIILWPPVKKYFKDILNEVSSEYEICHDCELDLQENFEKIVREIYKIDDIDRWKVELKINYLKDYSNSIYFILIKIPNIHFREKNKTAAPISTEVEVLKNKIRDSYKHKIDDYYYDIIIHMGDNYDQNKKMIKILEELGDIKIEKNNW